eukprot:SM000141S00871  [mRNA]  locus=s141:98186:101185:- [translate_table: standard]
MSDAVVNGLAGAGGGIIAQLLTYPLQAVNTRQQTERKVLKVSGHSSDQGPSNRAGAKAKGTAEELLEIIRKEGWSGIYRGLEPSLVGTAASQAVYYYFYQLFRDKAEARAIQRKKSGKGDGQVGMMGSLVVAALAGCLNVLLTNPIWIIVTRMQVLEKQRIAMELKKKAKSKSALSSVGTDILSESEAAALRDGKVNAGALGTALDLYREAGLLGFWKGVFPTLVMVSNPAIQFMIYESLMKRLTAKRPPSKHGLKSASATEIFLAGALAKLGATLATYPLLVVKSRLQAKQEIGVETHMRYRGTLDAVVKMVQHEGVLSFYKGMGTKIAQSVFAASVLFMTKEELVKLARALIERRTEAANIVIKSIAK